MRRPYTQLFVHFILGTWKRYGLIDKELEPILYWLISDKLIELKCKLLKIGGTEDHIHLLVKIHSSVSVSILAKSIKGYSSCTISNQIRPSGFFRWQGGYGAITVSPRDISVLSKYISNQKDHHSNNTLVKYWDIDEAQ